MKADELLDMIGDIDEDIIAEADMNNKKKGNDNGVIRIKWFRRPSALVAVAALVVLGAVTTFAAINGFWSRSIDGMLPSDSEQRLDIEDKGYVTALGNDTAGSGVSVTSEGVTITPVDVLCDGESAYVTFSVDGYDASQAAYLNIYETASIGDGTFDGSYGINASFYPGYTCSVDENGYDRTGFYDDGEPVEWVDEEHMFIAPRFADENGKLECIVHAYSDENLIGQVLHVNFGKIEEYTNSGEEKIVTGEWSFDIELAGCEIQECIDMGIEVGNSDFVLDKVLISPLSIKTYFNYNGKGDSFMNFMKTPVITQLILKDGTYWVPTGGGMAMPDEYDASHKKTINTVSFGKVINVDDIAALKINPGIESGHTELITVDLPNK